jgi:hypothetical protein
MMFLGSLYLNLAGMAAVAGLLGALLGGLRIDARFWLALAIASLAAFAAIQG